MTRSESAIENLRQGIKKMDESLSPLSRALRKFNAGRPTKRSVDTPLEAVLLAVEQRDRLSDLLSDTGARLTRTVIVIQAALPDGTPLQDWADVDEGEESGAVAFLEGHSRDGGSFVVSGLKFVFETADGEDVVDYPVERTPEGRKALGECKVFHVRRR